MMGTRYRTSGKLKIVVIIIAHTKPEKT